MIRLYRQWQAKRRLQRMVSANISSPKHQQFIKHRAAAKLGIDRKRGMA